MTTQGNIHALVLFSGGLDSQLAAVILRSQDISVTGVVFESIFFNAQTAINAAARLNIPLKIIDFNDTIISLIEHPSHGFGAGLNPCIDCHTAMIRMAGKIMRDEGLNFVATGEVLNERPMSQNRRVMPMIAKESGLEGYLLRPLSAKLLEITEPEKKKWVDREKLLSIEGRSRRPQLALARELGITSFPQPAGGCLLTDPGYGKKMRDLRNHGELRDLNSIKLLGTGRHFRLGKFKLIIGRNHTENLLLEKTVQKDLNIMKTISVPGPVAIISSKASEQDIQLAASICARYSDAGPDTQVTFEITTGKEKRIIKMLAAEQDIIDAVHV